MYKRVRNNFRCAIFMLIICLSYCGCSGYESSYTFNDNQTENAKKNISKDNICSFVFDNKEINVEVEILEQDKEVGHKYFYSPKCRAKSSKIISCEVKEKLINQVNKPYSANLVFEVNFEYIGDVIGADPVEPFHALATRMQLTSKTTGEEWSKGFWPESLKCDAKIYKKGDSGTVTFAFPYNRDLVEEGSTQFKLLLYYD